MRLILNGGGSGNQVTESYEIFAREVNGGKVMYIPLAWNNEDMENCINWFRAEMKPFGVTEIEQILKAEDVTKEKLSTVKGVFIGGGNTFKLLKMIKETPAFNNIKEYLENGGLVMGGSAGALIFGKSIDTCLKTELNISCTDENLVKLADTRGFDLCNGYSLFAHYKRKPEQIEKTEEAIQNLLKKGHKLICLPEETALWINDKNVSIIGQKPAELFSGSIKKNIQPKEKVDQYINSLNK